MPAQLHPTSSFFWVFSVLSRGAPVHDAGLSSSRLAWKNVHFGELSSEVWYPVSGGADKVDLVAAGDRKFYVSTKRMDGQPVAPPTPQIAPPLKKPRSEPTMPVTPRQALPPTTAPAPLRAFSVDLGMPLGASPALQPYPSAAPPMPASVFGPPPLPPFPWNPFPGGATPLSIAPLQVGPPFHPARCFHYL